MTDEEILAAIKARVRAGRPRDDDAGERSGVPAPARPGQVEEAERIIGFPVPPLLRRLYLEVANGGVGPGGGGILGLRGGHGSGSGSGEGLLDIYPYVRPTLNLMDGIVGMEGNGPSGGDPRQVGALLASTDALAMDIVCAHLVGFDPLAVYTTASAVKHGLTTGRLEDVPLLGDDLESLRVTDYRRGMAAAVDPGLLPKGVRGALRVEQDQEGDQRRGLLHRTLYGWLGKQFVVVPNAGPDCTGCGVCARHCPVEAITIVNKHATMDLDKCIRCYCCHELCPQLAVELGMPWLGRVLTRK